MTTFVNDNTGLNQDDNGNDRDDTRGDVVEVVKHGDSVQGKIWQSFEWCLIQCDWDEEGGGSVKWMSPKGGEGLKRKE